jgi:hypothetical protein
MSVVNNNNNTCDRFQESVSQLLIKHKSILDVLTKQQESITRVNRAIVKAVTSCGCIEIHASKQEIEDEISIENIHNALDSHLSGKLCDQCDYIVQQEIGNHMFYLASLCNLLDLNLLEIIQKEDKKIKTLGIYNMLR